MYRLLCIYDNSERAAISLRIEVNIDNNTKSISPFVRKVSVDGLRCNTSVGDALIPLLEHSGVINQPFHIDDRLLSDKRVYDLLKDYPLTYIRRGRLGTMRKGKIPLHYSSNLCNDVGELLGGELYITNLSQWNRNIRVCFRYKNTFSTFGATFSSLPFVDNIGQLHLRNEAKERELLRCLNGYDPQTETLSLKDAETMVDLDRICGLGWTIFAPKQGNTHTKLYAHRESSGIIWFSENENTEKIDCAQQLMEGFLKGRNYAEWNGQLALFEKKDIKNVETESLMECLELTPSFIMRYTAKVALSAMEKDTILNSVRKKIGVQLYPYQQEGVFWLLEQRKNHGGCLLADDMGLGKTLQIIAYLSCLSDCAKHLVIAPTSLIYNWKAEVLRFAPKLIEQMSFVSYDMLRIHIDDYSYIDYDTIIVDEAQIIKNRGTKKYAAVRRLHSQHKIILSGTPIENSIEEIWTHFMLLMPDMKAVYDKLHKNGVASCRDLYVSLTARLLKPFILRRTKEAVLKDLPKRTEKIVYVELTEQERAIYNNIRYAVLQSLHEGYTGRINSLVLEGLLRLRQACISPNLLPISLRNVKYLNSSKFTIALEYILQLHAESRKVLVFSQFVHALVELEKILKKHEIPYISLYGNTRNREQTIRDFQMDDSSLGVFLISLKAGGVGLNLTKADCVLLLDDWWNPAVEEQAIGRAHRIGQTHNVLVLRLVCRDTIEEKILALQDKKRHTIDVFNDAESSVTMSELMELLS